MEKYVSGSTNGSTPFEKHWSPGKGVYQWQVSLQRKNLAESYPINSKLVSAEIPKASRFFVPRLGLPQME